jgi:DNA-binding MarR family transcriptional regulator
VNAHETINDILVHLFNEIWELEAEAIITEEYKDISNNDMHIIEAIGPGVDSTMSMVAKKLGITAGSLTTSVNSLVNKKYVVRERSESDRRVVYIRLTEKGRRAFLHHKDFHMQMTDAVIQSLDADEIPVLLKTLNSLSEFFRGYQAKK